MKNMMSLVILSSVMLGGTLSAAEPSAANKGTTENQMIIRIGSKTFMATLAENPTATAFQAMLPLTVNMADLNDNEKLSLFQRTCRPMTPIQSRSRRAT